MKLLGAVTSLSIACFALHTTTASAQTQGAPPPPPPPGPSGATQPPDPSAQPAAPAAGQPGSTPGAPGGTAPAAAQPPVVVIVPVDATPPRPPTAPPTPRVPAAEPGNQGGVAGTGAGAPTTTPSAPHGLFAPEYPEDWYPGMPLQDGVLGGIPIDEKHGLRFAMHGYFRAPMRITKVPRAEGSTQPNEGDTDWRTPFLIDDDYFRSGFAYTHIQETDFTELYFSVGNDKVSATIQFQSSLYSDAARTDVGRQPGLSQGWLTYRTNLDFVPFFKTRLRVKAGAFWERYGHMLKYDTYIFARTHQMGENIRLELERDKLTLWLQHGIGTHLEDFSANQGLTLLHYATIGASWARTIELGGYIFDNQARDKRPLSQVTDASMGIIGVDLRVDSHYAGRLYGATSYISAENSTYLSPAVEVMHSYGGRGLTENYFGTQSSENGTGSLWNVGMQYDVSLADVYKGWTGKSSPLPWNGDLTGSLFGLYTFTQSKQASLDPLVNRDDRKAFKWGADAGYRITDWLGASVRYDRVVLDVDDSANSFRILSPRLSFFTSFITREMIYLQYSRYIYNERIRLRPGQQNLVTIPDDHVLKIQAQMTF